MSNPRFPVSEQEFIEQLRKKESPTFNEERILRSAQRINKNAPKTPSQEQLEILFQSERILRYRNSVASSLSKVVQDKLKLLLPPEKLWQPSDRKSSPSIGLPDFTSKNSEWIEDIQHIQERARGIPDSYLAILIGNAITEDALANYTPLFRTLVDFEPWREWFGGWTAEEHRHEKGLMAWLEYSGRVNMAEIDKSTQSLLRVGNDPRIGIDPYKLFIYTSFQELATKKSHTNTGNLAEKQGEPVLYRLCRAIGADEARHAKFYIGIMDKIFDLDPHGAMLSYSSLLRSGVVMPAENMNDGFPDLFKHFSMLAQREGVYTVLDYADIVSELNKSWHIRNRVVSGEALKSQDHLLKSPHNFKSKHHPRIQKRLANLERRTYPWLEGRLV